MNPNDKKLFSQALRFAKDLEVPATALKVETGVSVPARPVSSIGGAPSMHPDAEWPLCTKQRPMVFLAQINLTEMPQLKGFPNEGVLQFFVKDEDVFGLFTEEFRVEYHTQADALKRRSAPAVDHTPFGHRLHSEGAVLRGYSALSQPGFGCWQIDHYMEELEKAGASDEVFDALEDAFDKARPSIHYLGGHPGFDQGDVRGEDGRDLTAVLLQLGYQPDENGWDICWGDAGQATFLATQSDALNRDFSKVLYNWDCG